MKRLRTVCLFYHCSVLTTTHTIKMASSTSFGNTSEQSHNFEVSIQITRILNILSDTIKNTEIVVSTVFFYIFIYYIYLSS